ncbi:hypothetical protein KSP39_PZI011758 [Platanthera zijinensis]|uniref:Rho-GAP domain-containing protein n=1 Tax=Platanthera zijinensis TaxID=2320716 RepID=A0AAP0BEP2_9ASPA
MESKWKASYGNLLTLKRLVRRVQEYEQGKNEFSSDEDAHVIGDCIKLVLREMPSSPVPASCCTALVDAYRTDRVCRVDYIRDAIFETFPEPNRRLLQRTLKMMRTVAAHKAENRMSLSALAACMAPLLLRPLLAGECELKNEFQIDGDGSFQLLQAAAAANHAQAIVIILLEEYVKIFDNESSSSESEDEEDIEDDESTDNDILQEVGYYDEKNELKSHLVGDSDRSYSGTSRGNDSDVASEDSSDLGTDVGSDVGNYAGSDAPGNNVDNIGGSFMKSVASGDMGSSLSRDEARKNLSMESIEYTSDDESAVHRLENDKIDLQTKISKEIEGNAVLHASLDMRKNALHEHRLALEKEVVMLQVQLKKERDLRLHLELGLMDVQPDHFFNSACLDSKIKMDLEEIGLSIRDINILKQNIADITEQLQQDATLCESCGQPIYRENLKDEAKCSTILVDIQSFQNLPPKISNQSSTKSSGASSSSVDWHSASKKVEGWDCTKMDAHYMQEGASSALALTKLTNRLNFLKERRVQLANELLNLDPSRTTGPDSPSKTNSGSPAS